MADDDDKKAADEKKAADDRARASARSRSAQQEAPLVPFKNERGAQVILTNDARRAARGAFHGDIAGNTAARDAAIADGDVTHSMEPSERKPPVAAVAHALGEDEEMVMTVEQAQAALDRAKEREKMLGDDAAAAKEAQERDRDRQMNAAQQTK